MDSNRPSLHYYHQFYSKLVKVKRLKRSMGLWLSVLFMLSNVVLPHRAECSIWDERNNGKVQLASLPMSMSMGSMGSLLPHNPSPSINQFISKPMSRVLVKPAAKRQGLSITLIQDIHQHAEAQSNIASILKSLSADNNSEKMIVGLEGTSGFLNYKRYGFLPRQDIVKNVSDEFLKKGSLLGSSHFALTEKSSSLLYGLENPYLYQRNVQAYLQAELKRKDLRAKLAVRKESLVKEKNKIYSPALLQLDLITQQYNKDELSLGAYVEELAGFSPGITPSMPILVFLEAVQLERTLNFPLVEKEREAVLSSLSKKLAKDEINVLLEKSVHFKKGNISFGEFYGWLSRFLKQNDVSLTRYPLFNQYIQYALLSDTIDGDVLLNDIARFEKDLYARYLHTKAERSLYHNSRQLFLTERLIDFSLSPKEWAEYAKGKTISPDLKSFEDYYRFAEKRNGDMVKNLLDALAKHHVQNGVLIAGGFHADGLSAILKKRAITFDIVSPKITSLGDGSSPLQTLSLFQIQKSPLEKKFKSEKLFLGAYDGIAGPTLVPTINIAQSFPGAVARELAKAGVDPNLTDPLLKQSRIGRINSAPKSNNPDINDSIGESANLVPLMNQALAKIKLNFNKLPSSVNLVLDINHMFWAADMGSAAALHSYVIEEARGKIETSVAFLFDSQIRKSLESIASGNNEGLKEALVNLLFILIAHEAKELELSSVAAETTTGAQVELQAMLVSARAYHRLQPLEKRNLKTLLAQLDEQELELEDRFYPPVAVYDSMDAENLNSKDNIEKLIELLRKDPDFKDGLETISIDALVKESPVKDLSAPVSVDNIVGLRKVGSISFEKVPEATNEIGYAIDGIGGAVITSSAKEGLRMFDLLTKEGGGKTSLGRPLYLIRGIHFTNIAISTENDILVGISDGQMFLFKLIRNQETKKIESLKKIYQDKYPAAETIQFSPNGDAMRVTHALFSEYGQAIYDFANFGQKSIDEIMSHPFKLSQPNSIQTDGSFKEGFSPSGDTISGMAFDGSDKNNFQFQLNRDNDNNLVSVDAIEEDGKNAFQWNLSLKGHEIFQDFMPGGTIAVVTRLGSGVVDFYKDDSGAKPRIIFSKKLKFRVYPRRSSVQNDKFIIFRDESNVLHIYSIQEQRSGFEKFIFQVVSPFKKIISRIFHLVFLFSIYSGVYFFLVGTLKVFFPKDKSGPAYGKGVVPHKEKGGVNEHIAEAVKDGRFTYVKEAGKPSDVLDGFDAFVEQHKNNGALQLNPLAALLQNSNIITIPSKGEIPGLYIRGPNNYAVAHFGHYDGGNHIYIDAQTFEYLKDKPQQLFTLLLYELSKLNGESQETALALEQALLSNELRTSIDKFMDDSIRNHPLIPQIKDYYAARSGLLEAIKMGYEKQYQQNRNKIIEAGRAVQNLTANELVTLIQHLKSLPEKDLPVHPELIIDDLELMRVLPLEFENDYTDEWNGMLAEAEKYLDALGFDESLRDDIYRDIKNISYPLTLLNILPKSLKEIQYAPNALQGLSRLAEMFFTSDARGFGGAVTIDAALDQDFKILIKMNEGKGRSREVYIHELTHYLALRNLLPFDFINEVVTTALSEGLAYKANGKAGYLQRMSKVGENFVEYYRAVIELAETAAAEPSDIGAVEKIESKIVALLESKFPELKEAASLRNDDSLQRMTGLYVGVFAAIRVKNNPDVDFYKFISSYGRRYLPKVRNQNYQRKITYKDQEVIDKLMQANLKPKADTIARDSVTVRPRTPREVRNGDSNRWEYHQDGLRLDYLPWDIIAYGDASAGLMLQEIFRSLYSENDVIEEELKKGPDARPFGMVFGLAETLRVIHQGYSRYKGYRESKEIEAYYQKRFRIQDLEIEQDIMNEKPLFLQYVEGLFYLMAQNGQSEKVDIDPRITNQEVIDVLKDTLPIILKAIGSNKKDFYDAIKNQVWPEVKRLLAKDREAAKEKQLKQDAFNKMMEEGEVEITDGETGESLEGVDLDQLSDKARENLDNSIKKYMEKMEPKERGELEKEAQEKASTELDKAINDEAQEIGDAAPEGNPQPGGTGKGPLKPGFTKPFDQNESPQNKGTPTEKDIEQALESLKERAKNIEEKVQDVEAAREAADRQAEEAKNQAGAIQKDGEGTPEVSEDLKKALEDLDEKIRDLRKASHNFHGKVNDLEDTIENLDEPTQKDLQDLKEQLRQQAETIEKNATEIDREAAKAHQAGHKAQNTQEELDQRMKNQATDSIKGRAENIKKTMQEIQESLENIEESAAEARENASDFGNSAPPETSAELDDKDSAEPRETIQEFLDNTPADFAKLKTPKDRQEEARRAEDARSTFSRLVRDNYYKVKNSLNNYPELLRNNILSAISDVEDTGRFTPPTKEFGTLKSKGIVKAGMGASNSFSKRLEPDSVTIRISLLMDLSGSMFLDASNQGYEKKGPNLNLRSDNIQAQIDADNRINNAIKTFILFMEAFKAQSLESNAKVELEVGGFRNDQEIFKKFEDPINDEVIISIIEKMLIEGHGNTDLAGQDMMIRSLRARDASSGTAYKMMVTIADGGIRSAEGPQLQKNMEENKDILFLVVGIGPDSKSVLNAYGEKFAKTIESVGRLAMFIGRWVSENAVRLIKNPVVRLLIIYSASLGAELILSIFLKDFVFTGILATTITTYSLLKPQPNGLESVYFGYVEESGKTYLVMNEGTDLYDPSFKYEVPDTIGKNISKGSLVETKTNVMRVKKIIRHMSNFRDMGSPPLYLFGEAGSGKNLLLNYAARLMRKRAVVISFHEDTEVDAINWRRSIGEAEAGRTKYILSAFTQAKVNGDWIILDEFNKGRPSVKKAINNLIKPKNFTTPDSESYTEGEGFAIAVTANPNWGPYKVKDENTEFYDRSTVIDIEYLPPEEEAQVLYAEYLRKAGFKPGAIPIQENENNQKIIAVIQGLVNSANSIRNKYYNRQSDDDKKNSAGFGGIGVAVERPLSTRALVKIVKHMAQFRNLETSELDRVRSVIKRYYSYEWASESQIAEVEASLDAEFGADKVISFAEDAVTGEGPVYSKNAEGQRVLEFKGIQIPVKNEAPKSKEELDPDAEVIWTESGLKQLYEIMLDLKLQNHMLFIGENGTGKDFIAAYLTTLIYGVGTEFVPMSSETVLDEILSYLALGEQRISVEDAEGEKANANESHYALAYVGRAMKKGKAVVLSEITSARTGARGGLNNVLQDRFYDTPNSERVNGEDGFLIIGTGNPWGGAYKGVEKPSGEELDRYSVHKFEFLPGSEEVAILVKKNERIIQKKPQAGRVKKDFLEKLVEFIGELRKAYRNYAKANTAADADDIFPSAPSLRGGEKVIGELSNTNLSIEDILQLLRESFFRGPEYYGVIEKFYGKIFDSYKGSLYDYTVETGDAEIDSMLMAVHASTEETLLPALVNLEAVIVNRQKKGVWIEALKENTARYFSSIQVDLVSEINTTSFINDVYGHIELRINGQLDPQKVLPRLRQEIKIFEMWPEKRVGGDYLKRQDKYKGGAMVAQNELARIVEIHGKPYLLLQEGAVESDLAHAVDLLGVRMMGDEEIKVKDGGGLLVQAYDVLSSETVNKKYTDGLKLHWGADDTQVKKLLDAVSDLSKPSTSKLLYANRFHIIFTHLENLTLGLPQKLAICLILREILTGPLMVVNSKNEDKKTYGAILDEIIADLKKEIAAGTSGISTRWGLKSTAPARLLENIDLIDEAPASLTFVHLEDKYKKALHLVIGNSNSVYWAKNMPSAAGVHLVDDTPVLLLDDDMRSVLENWAESEDNAKNQAVSDFMKILLIHESTELIARGGQTTLYSSQATLKFELAATLADAKYYFSLDESRRSLVGELMSAIDQAVGEEENRFKTMAILYDRLIAEKADEEARVRAMLEHILQGPEYREKEYKNTVELIAEHISAKTRPQPKIEPTVAPASYESEQEIFMKNFGHAQYSPDGRFEYFYRLEGSEHRRPDDKLIVFINQVKRDATGKITNRTFAAKIPYTYRLMLRFSPFHSGSFVAFDMDAPSELYFYANSPVESIGLMTKGGGLVTADLLVNRNKSNPVWSKFLGERIEGGQFVSDGSAFLFRTEGLGVYLWNLGEGLTYHEISRKETGGRTVKDRLNYIFYYGNYGIAKASGGSTHIYNFKIKKKDDGTFSFDANHMSEIKFPNGLTIDVFHEQSRFLTLSDGTKILADDLFEKNKELRVLNLSRALDHDTYERLQYAPSYKEILQRFARGYGQVNVESPKFYFFMTQFIENEPIEGNVETAFLFLELVKDEKLIDNYLKYRIETRRVILENYKAELNPISPQGYFDLAQRLFPALTFFTRWGWGADITNGDVGQAHFEDMLASDEGFWTIFLKALEEVPPPLKNGFKKRAPEYVWASNMPSAAGILTLTESGAKNTTVFLLNDSLRKLFNQIAKLGSEDRKLALQDFLTLQLTHEAKELTLRSDGNTLSANLRSELEAVLADAEVYLSLDETRRNNLKTFMRVLDGENEAKPYSRMAEIYDQFDKDPLRSEAALQQILKVIQEDPAYGSVSEIEIQQVISVVKLGAAAGEIKDQPIDKPNKRISPDGRYEYQKVDEEDSGHRLLVVEKVVSRDNGGPPVYNVLRTAFRYENSVEIRFSPGGDGQYVYWGTDKPAELYFYDPITFERKVDIHQWASPGSPAWSTFKNKKIVGAEFSPEGDALIIQTSDGGLFLWNKKEELIQRVLRHKESAPLDSLVHLIPGGKYAFARAADGGLHVYKFEITNRDENRFEFETVHFEDFDLPDGRQMTGVSEDQRFILLDNGDKILVWDLISEDFIDRNKRLTQELVESNSSRHMYMPEPRDMLINFARKYGEVSVDSIIFQRFFHIFMEDNFFVGDESSVFIFLELVKHEKFMAEFLSDSPKIIKKIKDYYPGKAPSSMRPYFDIVEDLFPDISLKNDPAENSSGSDSDGMAVVSAQITNPSNGLGMGVVWNGLVLFVSPSSWGQFSDSSFSLFVLGIVVMAILAVYYNGRQTKEKVRPSRRLSRPENQLTPPDKQISEIIMILGSMNQNIENLFRAQLSADLSQPTLFARDTHVAATEAVYPTRSPYAGLIKTTKNLDKDSVRFLTVRNSDDVKLISPMLEEMKQVRVSTNKDHRLVILNLGGFNQYGGTDEKSKELAKVIERMVPSALIGSQVVLLNDKTQFSNSSDGVDWIEQDLVLAAAQTGNGASGWTALLDPKSPTEYIYFVTGLDLRLAGDLRNIAIVLIRSIAEVGARFNASEYLDIQMKAGQAALQAA